MTLATQKVPLLYEIDRLKPPFDPTTTSTEVLSPRLSFLRPDKQLSTLTVPENSRAVGRTVIQKKNTSHPNENTPQESTNKDVKRQESSKDNVITFTIPTKQPIKQWRDQLTMAPTIDKQPSLPKTVPFSLKSTGPVTNKAKDNIIKILRKTPSTTSRGRPTISRRWTSPAPLRVDQVIHRQVKKNSSDIINTGNLLYTFLFKR